MGHHKHLEGNEHPQSHLYQLISITGFAAIWTLDTFVIEFSTQLNAYTSGVFRFIIAIPVFLLAFYLMWAAGKTLFIESEHSSGLITGGILARVRHPLYLGSLLICLGFLISSMSLIAMVAYVGVCLVHNNLANYEEMDLIRIYGDEYIEYRNKVPKWIPLRINR
jgi:protein-S-isoprenylcysteine O-methyltransferase Ste14